MYNINLNKTTATINHQLHLTILVSAVPTIETINSNLFQPAHVDVIWRHEEDGGQRASVHLGHRDGEDEEPGEDAGYRVDHSQDGITQKKPKVSADAPLQRFKDKPKS